MRRAASLRGFSNAKVITENPEHSVSNDETKEPKPKTKGYESSNKYIFIFSIKLICCIAFY